MLISHKLRHTYLETNRQSFLLLNKIVQQTYCKTCKITCVIITETQICFGVSYKTKISQNHRQYVLIQCNIFKNVAMVSSRWVPLCSIVIILCNRAGTYPVSTQSTSQTYRLGTKTARREIKRHEYRNGYARLGYNDHRCSPNMSVYNFSVDDLCRAR